MGNPKSAVLPDVTLYSLRSDQRNTLNKLLQRHSKVFSQNATDIGRVTVAEHSINTVPHPPIQLRPYRRPQHEYDVIRQNVKELQAKGIIRESESPWAFPSLLVGKKGRNRPTRR